MFMKDEIEWLNGWTAASHAVGGAWGVEFLSAIQEIARIEIELRRRETQYEGWIKSGNTQAMLSLEATNVFPLSVAWVFLAFEMLRTLIAAIERKFPAYRSQRKHSLRQAKTIINRLRARLAKHEAAGNSGDTWDVAVLGRRFPMKVGWFLQDDEFITRRDLADMLRDALIQSANLNAELTNAKARP
ncbi:hypothetical protein [Achromobacter dolens]|jgi:hypothetical protein|uniref:hypothetical protein n=4 Tax=Achromobacter dolens TaxID=1287738 RepID=UPI003558EEDD